jgi:hypothetical protein
MYPDSSNKQQEGRALVPRNISSFGASPSKAKVAEELADRRIREKRGDWSAN